MTRALSSTPSVGQPKATGLTYESAGVSVDAGNSLVERIKPFVKSTVRSGSDGSIGGFGGAFDLKATGYRDPVLVSGTDGVGTKLKVAMKAGIHGTVGTCAFTPFTLILISVNQIKVSTWLLCLSMISLYKAQSLYTSLITSHAAV